MNDQSRFDPAHGFNGVTLIYANFPVHVDASGDVNIWELVAADQARRVAQGKGPGKTLTQILDRDGMKETIAAVAKRYEIVPFSDRRNVPAVIRKRRGRGQQTWAHRWVALAVSYELTVECRLWFIEEMDKLRERMSQTEFWDHAMPGVHMVDALETAATSDEFLEDDATLPLFEPTPDEINSARAESDDDGAEWTRDDGTRADIREWFRRLDQLPVEIARTECRDAVQRLRLYETKPLKIHPAHRVSYSMPVAICTCLPTQAEKHAKPSRTRGPAYALPCPLHQPLFGLFPDENPDDYLQPRPSDLS